MCERAKVRWFLVAGRFGPPRDPHEWVITGTVGAGAGPQKVHEADGEGPQLLHRAARRAAQGLPQEAASTPHHAGASRGKQTPKTQTRSSCWGQWGRFSNQKASSFSK